MPDFGNPKSICQCNHSGDGLNSSHVGVGPRAGHGACLVTGCECQRFTWAAFTDEYQSHLDKKKAEATP